MVASENGDSLRVADFQSNQESDSLNGVVSSVDVVSYERRFVSDCLASREKRKAYP